LTSPLDGGEWSALCPGHFTSRERAPSTHWIEGWVDPRAILMVLNFQAQYPKMSSSSASRVGQQVEKFHIMRR